MSGHKGQVVGYVRVSAADQNEARQLEVLGEVDRLFSEKVSGKSREREQLEDVRLRPHRRRGPGEVPRQAFPLHQGSAGHGRGAAGQGASRSSSWTTRR